MSKHTPGPWAIVDGHYPCMKEVIGPSFKIHIVMSATDLDFNDFLKRSADAQLIAAAPELLEALIGLVSIANDSAGVAGYHLNGAVADWDEFEEVVAAIKAITKATGDHP